MATVALAGTPLASTSNTLVYTTASFTPVVGDLLVVSAAATATVETSATLTASANGITFTQIAVQQTNAGIGVYWLFVADQLVPSSPSSMTVTLTIASDDASGCTITPFRVTGMSRTGLDAILQSVTADNNLTGGSTPQTVFTNPATTTNPILCGLSNNTNPAGVTEPSGFTELSDTGHSSPNHGSESAKIDSGFTSTTITWGSTSSRGTVWALEFDASSPGSVFTETPSDNVGITDSVEILLQLPNLTWQQASLHTWADMFVYDSDAGTPARSSWNRKWEAPGRISAGGFEPVGVDDTESVNLVSGVTFTRPATDPMGITDTAIIALNRTIAAGENIGIVDSVSLSQNKGKLELIGITDSSFFSYVFNRTDNVGITDTHVISFGGGILQTDNIGILDVVTFLFGKGFTDTVFVQDTVSMVQSKGFTDTVGITDTATVAMPITVNVTDSIGITDSITILLEAAGDIPDMSLVDEKREAAIGYLVTVAGLNEDDLRLLTIEDLAHKYWSHRAGDMDNQALSILDHLVNNGFGFGWDWLRLIVEAP